MIRRASALALLAGMLAAAAPAAAEETRPQQVFKKRLLQDRTVAREIKRVLRNGGFVDRDVRFGDLTGDDRSDAVVLVNDGGSAGRIAIYVFSSHRPRQSDGGGGNELRIRYRNQNLFRARASLKGVSTKRPNGAVVYSTPVYDAGDELGDPGARRYIEVRWRPKRNRFGVISRRTVDRVRARYCSSTGDFCTRVIKSKREVIHLSITSPSLSGRYALCVTAPGRRVADCRRFTLRRRGGGFVSQVRWSTNFPDGGEGRYRVVWKLGREKLGPTLGFRVA